MLFHSLKVLSVLWLLLVVQTQPVVAQMDDDPRYTVITGTGQSLFRIAIPPILDGGGVKESTQIASTVLRNDMTLIGLFKIINPKGFLANLQKEGTGINAQDWINVGAQAVIKGRAQQQGNKITIDFFLYEPNQSAAPVLTRSFSSNAHGIRRSAHEFGNEVVNYFTKEPGVFTTRISFASANPQRKTSQIYVMDFDGFGVFNLSKTGDQNILPTWSPDGRIAYTSLLWRNPDLFLVPSSGGRAQRISKWPGLNSDASWSPQGDKIALTLSKDGNAEIYLINDQGTIIRRLTNNSAIDTSPTWSPDGSQIAFVSNRGGSPQIYVMSSNGEPAKRLTYRGTYNQEPSWCPLKENPVVAFTARDESGHFDIFSINVDTGELKRLTQGQGNNKSSSWAPNGRLIVFSSTRGGLWIMDADGLNQHQIYRGRQAQTPAWSKR
ncbi:MAG: hypothetical protein V1754_15520 [Pseudomonadota bacterium]